MRNKFRTIFITLGILTAALCFSSCWNSVSNNADQSNPSEITTVLFKGKINPDSSLPKDLLISKADKARAAGPDSLDMMVFEYYVTATSSTGTVLIAEVTEDPATHLITFEMPLSFGTWTIETVIRNISTQEAILSDSFTTELLKSSPTFSHTFYLKPVTGGQGSIALEISVPTAIEKMHIEVQSKPKNAVFENEDITPESNKININHTNLASGAYTVILSFYDDKSIVYTSVQTINVLRGLQTTKWFSNGSSTLISNDGKFVISNEVIQAWRSQRTHYYIDYNSGDDFNSGAPLDPFKTLSKTIAIINDVYGTETKEITISILNGSNENITAPIIINQNKKITIQADDNSSTTLLRAYTGAFIEIPSSSELIISNFIFDGKEIEAEGNIGLKNEGILRMTGCTIKDNKNTASDLGAGIFNAAAASLYLTDVEITGNFSDYYGAGILNNGTAQLENTLISGNHCTDDGAGLYNKGTATVNSSTISSNTSNAQGGGILNEGNLTLNNTTITGNSSGEGGGIANKKTLNLNSGEISENTAFTKGGGIFLTSDTDAAINISGGIVKNNTLSDVETTKSNLYLPEGKKIHISEAIKNGSEIWITFGWIPKKITTADNTIFTEGYGATNSQAPSTYFKSDERYILMALPTSTTPAAIEAGFALSGKDYVNVLNTFSMTFAINIDKFKQGDEVEANRTIAITPTLILNGDNITENVLSNTENPLKWKLTLYYRGIEVGSSNTSELRIDSGYTGRYDLHVCAEYLGIVKDAEFVITGYNNIIPVTTKEQLTDTFTKITNGDAQITRDTCINLTEDLDLSAEPYYPISAKVSGDRIINTNTDFEGVFDGNGHTITLGKVVSEDFIAICFRNKGIIQNVIIEADTANYPVIISEGTTLHNDATNPDEYKFHAFGGICHFNEGIIRNCWNKVTIESASYYGRIGGICCGNSGLIENCINSGDLKNCSWSSGKGSWRGVYGAAGGITGFNWDNGVIRNCVNYGEIWLNTYYDSEGIGINGLPGAICGAQNTGRNTAKVEYCYWRENCVRSDKTSNRDASTSTQRNWLVAVPTNYSINEIEGGTFANNGYFPSNSNGTLSNDLSINGHPQNLPYGNNLEEALNAYANAVDPNHTYLKRWKADSTYAAIFE